MFHKINTAMRTKLSDPRQINIKRLKSARVILQRKFRDKENNLWLRKE